MGLGECDIGIFLDAWFFAPQAGKFIQVPFDQRALCEYANARVYHALRHGISIFALRLVSRHIVSL